MWSTDAERNKEILMAGIRAGKMVGESKNVSKDAAADIAVGTITGMLIEGFGPEFADLLATKLEKIANG